MNDEDQERAKVRDAAEVRLAVAREWVLRCSLDVLRARVNENLLAANVIKGHPLSITVANDDLEHAARELAEASIAIATLERS
jgi:hypothetical protein